MTLLLKARSFIEKLLNPLDPCPRSYLSSSLCNKATPGLVQIAILSDEGKPSDTLLDKVRSQICNDTIRMLTDTVEVISCTIIPLTIKAVIHLDPKIPLQFVTAAKDTLVEKLNTEKGLGWSVTTSWIIAHLFAEGMLRVELLEPTADVIVLSDACVELIDLDVRLL